MMNLVVQGINYCVNTVLSILAPSAYVGQAIVTILTWIFNFTTGLFGFLNQVVEDNRSLFTLEVPSMVLDAPNVFIAHFCEAAEWIGDATVEFYSSILKPIVLTAEFMLLSLYNAVVLVKNFLVILGDSLWLIITFIPVHLPGIARTLGSWLLQILSQGAIATYSSLLRITNYLTDVPLHSIAGIIFAVIIVRIIVDFQVEILSIVSRCYRWSITRLLVYYYAVYNYFMDEEMRIINQLVGDRLPAITEDIPEERPEGEALCVVCQERQKCMLILPCRHICLCCECCMRLYNYQRTCPICRTFICHSVNVYL